MNYEFYPENCHISLFVELKKKAGIALLQPQRCYVFMKLCIMYKQVFKQKGD